jgi:hypothetical protein
VAASIAQHLTGCVPCRDEARALEALLAEAAALPRSVEPAHDLWGSIASRLDVADRAMPRRPGLPPVWVALLAASIVVALVGGWALTRTGGTLPPGGPAEDAIPASGGTTSVGAAEGALLELKGQLRATLDAQGERLAPETAAVVDGNLDLVERAIDEIRAALAADPGNPELGRRLIAAHRSEVQLLRRMTENTARL